MPKKNSEVFSSQNFELANVVIVRRNAQSFSQAITEGNRRILRHERRNEAEEQASPVLDTLSRKG